MPMMTEIVTDKLAYLRTDKNNKAGILMQIDKEGK